MALWDSAVLPPGARKRRVGDGEGEEDIDRNAAEAQPVMNFTLLTKRGNKQQVSRTLEYHWRLGLSFFQARQLAVPAASALAVHTRSAQLQDKEEQQHLKRLVLDYEQREEAEEVKGACILIFQGSICTLLNKVYIQLLKPAIVLEESRFDI